MLLSFAGLQALKISHEYYLSDTSAVWTLTEVARQGLHIKNAWEALTAIPHYPLARLLGHQNPIWDTINFPDVL